MPKTHAFRVLLAAALTAQLLSIPTLWGHTSTPAQVFGRYSTDYALVLLVNVVLIVTYAAALVAAGWVARMLPRVPGKLPLLVLAGVVIAGLWLLRLETTLVGYLSLNWVLLVAIVLSATPDAPDPVQSVEVRRALVAALAALALVLLMARVITTLSMNNYTPDEAGYADLGSTYWAEGRVQYRTWLLPPLPIEPGYGWGLAGYGWLLETIGYSVRIGRVLNLLFMAGLLAGGVYAVTAHLYGRAAAWVSGGFALFSLTFALAWDFRPSYFVAVISIWALYAMLAARDAQNRGARYTLHALVGLVPVLGLQVHASSVVVAFAFSVYYGAGMVVALVRRDWGGLRDGVAFGVGALIGTLVYVVANIMPVGAELFFSLLGERSSPSRPLLFFAGWRSLFEGVLILLALGFIAWRRTPADRTLLTITVLMVLSAILLDSQGYLWHTGALYLVPVGVLLTQAVPARARTLTILAALFMLLGQLHNGFIDWNSVRYTAQNASLPPYLYDELKPLLPQHVHDDDVIYSTHQLIWIFPHTGTPNVLSYTAENDGMRRFNVRTPVEVWEQVQPTVIIFVENQMQYNPGMVAYLERYPFEQCAQFTVQQTDITVYRPDCAAFVAG